jgi:uncharacterized protein YbjQ (UPF0145 family)
MIQTTTPGVDGRTINEYLGVVTGEAILGVGIDLDYETVGNGSMLMVTASGTAVRLGA